MKNSQVAVLCGAILAGSLIVAGTNVWLVRSLGSPAAGAAPAAAAAPSTAKRAGDRDDAEGEGRSVLRQLPRRRRGSGAGARRRSDLGRADQPRCGQAERARRELDHAQGGRRSRWRSRTGRAFRRVLRKARERGIKVLTWDADAEPDARDFFVNQATAEGIGNTLTDEAARLLGGKGEFAIITGALSAANQNEWIAFIKKRLAEKYPNLKLATIRPSDDDRDKAFAETQTIMRVFPSVKLVMAISAALAGDAEDASWLLVFGDDLLPGVVVEHGCMMVVDGSGAGVSPCVLCAAVDEGGMMVRAW